MAACSIAAKKSRSSTDLTYSKDVAPILQKNCQACHRPEQAAPFSLMTYDDAVKHARMISEVDSQRRMPPWHADSRHGNFSNDRRLSRLEIDTLTAWVAGDMPRATTRTCPTPSTGPRAGRTASPTWSSTCPRSSRSPPPAALPYKNWIIDTKFNGGPLGPTLPRPGRATREWCITSSSTSFATGRSARHRRQLVSVLVGWAPGDLGLVCPPDTALRLPKGCKLRFEMHYTPNGKAVKDRSSVGHHLRQETAEVRDVHQRVRQHWPSRCPPHDPHYKAEASLPLPRRRPHPQLRARTCTGAARITATRSIYPDGKREDAAVGAALGLQLAERLSLPGAVQAAQGRASRTPSPTGTIRVNNPLNPAPEKKVTLRPANLGGDDGRLRAYVWERPETAAELAKNPPSPADLFFDRLDVNGDDFITPNEIPENMQPIIKLLGAKVPDKITRKEFAAIYEKMSKRFGRPKRPDSTKPPR